VQLFAKHCAAGLVHAERRVPIAGGDVEFHQAAMRFLIQRTQGYPASSCGDGLDELSLLRLALREPAEHSLHLLAAGLALETRPFVKVRGIGECEPLQELTATDLGGQPVCRKARRRLVGRSHGEAGFLQHAQDDFESGVDIETDRVAFHNEMRAPGPRA
jgi:hypothetical protein